MKAKRPHFAFLFLLLVSHTFQMLLSQQTSPNIFTGELSIKFDAMEQKKLAKAEKMILEAEQLIQEAGMAFETLPAIEKKERLSPGYQSVLKKLLEASQLQKEAHSLAFSVFKDRNNTFWQKMSRNYHRASGMDKARYYESEALKHQNRSIIRRQQVLESDRYEYSTAIMKDALQLEQLAVRDQGRALQICTDYPVEYNYGWEDDKSLEEVIAILRDPNVHEPPDDIFATVDVQAPVDSSLLREIIFKVQIAAHTDPLSDDYLRAVYKGPIRIDMIYEENWYKYSIGRYFAFDEAEATLREVNIKKAFIVAYQEGKKITTQEAVALIEKRGQIN